MTSVNDTADEPSSFKSAKTPWFGSLRRAFGRMFRRKDSDDLLGSLEDLVEASASDEGINENEGLDTQQRLLIGNILRLRERLAEDIAIPRADIAAVPLDATLTQILDLAMERGHSRLPVYDGSLDKIVGLVHVRDLIPFKGTKRALSLKKIMRAPLYVSPGKPVLDLLFQMQSARTHMALMVDEFGGVDGLITIEDALEQIVGEIEDEHDLAEKPDIRLRDDGTWMTDARYPLDTLETEHLGVFLSDEDREEDFDTIGGLVFHLAGRVPARGEIISHSSGYSFRVTQADARRVRRLIILPPSSHSGLGP